MEKEICKVALPLSESREGRAAHFEGRVGPCSIWPVLPIPVIVPFWSPRPAGSFWRLVAGYTLVAGVLFALSPARIFSQSSAKLTIIICIAAGRDVLQRSVLSGPRAI
jgi:hypothetical protein